MQELTAPRAALSKAALSEGALSQAMWVSADLTLGVAAIARIFPSGWHTTMVGVAFLGAVWALVWRKDDDAVRRAGLALGGLVMPGKLDVAGIARAGGKALAWAAGLTAVIAVPYYLGWKYWWDPRLTFSLAVRPVDAADELLGQLLVIALPEEAFYRGYLQSRLDEVWAPRWRVLGAEVGPGLLVSALIFAVGHLATVQVPARLAVFFPALVFGWLRARTKGIGASVFFHAGCNIYSLALGRGYGLY